jgi:hypothetical protein
LKAHLHDLRRRIKSGASILDDNSVVNRGDNYVVNCGENSVVNDDDHSVVNEFAEVRVQGGDNSVVDKSKWLEEDGDNFHRRLWKSLWKSPVLISQTTEIYGLLALCTKFVQCFVTLSSPSISRLTGKILRISGIFATGSRALTSFAEKLCKTRPRLSRNPLKSDALMRPFSIEWLFKSLLGAVAKLVCGLQDFAGFGTFGRPYHALSLHLI